ncbi:MAG: hypothetical protein KJO07_12650 [Deltaproteobacteria bacterium]|nr:hypothetical protein [Deltaproteobacteria bacterium]
MKPQDKLTQALTQRLGMQISLSSLPVVEEWMDAKLNRWLESIPLPMEMPSGDAHITVAVAADMQELEWSAFGTPSGFIPKLAKYLDKSGAQKSDLDRINALGESFEPGYVGSWIRVVPGETSTGWQFEHDFEISALREHFGDGEGPDAVAAWLESSALGRCLNISSTLGTDQTLVAMALEGEGWPAMVGKAFEDHGQGVDAAPLVEFLAQSQVRGPRLELGFDGAGIHRVGVRFEGIKSDDLASISRLMSLSYEPGMLALGNALGADGIRALRFSSRAGQAHLEARFAPGEKEPPAPGGSADN